jgi:transcriptional regulator with XRE-family HTH domain
MPDFDLRRLGQRLREARRKLGLTQTSLGEQMGVSHGWISEIEAGKQTRLEAETVFRFAEALRVSADYLLGLSDVPYPGRRRTRKQDDDSELMPTALVWIGV